MAYSGIFIPVSESSSIYVFDKIFADIGDEQSINSSLSTFSSHMTNIISIINESTSNSLILLDELGSGTDPVEGSKLAISILEYFSDKNCLTFCTTHYHEIKEYCLTHKNFENACVEFNLKTLKPTYKLLIGIPGKSNAFAISKQLGLVDSIIKRASNLMNEDETDFEELLKNIYNDKSFIEHEKEEIEKKSKQIDLLKKEYELKLISLTNKEDKIIDDAKSKARKILEDAKDASSIALKQISDVTSSSKDLNNIRNNLNNAIKNTLSYKNNEIKITSPNNSNPIKVGDIVLVLNLNKEGKVINIKKDIATVQIEQTRLNIKTNNLSYIGTAKKINPHGSVVKNNDIKNRKSSTEIKVIGLAVDEAIFLIDKFLDDCILSGLNEVRIVHGKGTGTLRNGIHAFLKKHPHVESFRIGTFGEGEMGATVVTLKK